MDFASKDFWIIFVLFTFLNAAVFRFRSRRYIQEDPDLAEGYSKIIRGFVFWGNLPWIVMGAGCVLGGVPSIYHFLQPRQGNPFVLAFFASVFLIWGLGTFWLLFRSGAEMLVRHPGLFSVEIKSPRTVKLFWFLCLGGGVAGVVMMFLPETPIPLQ